MMLKSLLQKLKSPVKGSWALLKEEKKKISDTIKSGDMDMISVGHGLLEVVQCRMETGNNCPFWRKSQKSVRK